MSTPTETGQTATPDAPTLPLKVVSHSPLFYWWPVWTVGFILAALTYADNTRLVIVPPGTLVEEVEANRVFRLTVKEPTPALEKAVRAATGQDAFPIRVARNQSFGVVYFTVVLIVIFGSNAPLRGLASLLAVLSLILGVIVLSYLDWWDPILDFLGGLHIEISLAGYLLSSSLLLAAWLVVFFLYDPLRYATFAPGQLIVHRDIGDQSEVYDTILVQVEKRPSDLLRHWILGLGAGDLIITIPSQSRQIELPNVLFVHNALAQIATRLKTQMVVSRQP